ncbi:MAG: hypothetical protein H6756_01055 [Candidatus Omnitrophica bacterium]|nr:hypothetical protein [Candidatus Omnitrophota bacterium]
MRTNRSRWLLFLILTVPLTGCVSTAPGGNKGHLPTYPFTKIEPEWIRNGEPVDFEGELWFPQDGIESLTDQEVLPVGNYRDVQLFVDKVDVRPFDRVYTKFGVNKYRYFERTKTGVK